MGGSSLGRKCQTRVGVAVSEKPLLTTTQNYGAMKLSIMTLSIMALSIMALSIMAMRIGLICDSQHKRHSA